MEIKNIKLHEVLTCKENESVSEIARKLKEKKERRVFVVDSAGKLRGIITTTDLVYKALVGGNAELKAEDVMTKDVKSVDATEDLNKALEIMNSLKSFVCPVTKEGRLVGVISYHDLVGYVLSSLRE